MNRNVETFISCDSEYDDAKFAIFGAPFDSTTSFRPGTRFGPSAIRHESFGIETYSPYQKKDLEDIKAFDLGDLELCIGDSSIALNSIEKTESKFFSDGKIPVMLGGEHLVTLGAVRAALKKYPNLHIIQFDAHADLRDDYLGATLSHACVMRRCFDEMKSDERRIHQFCIRSGEKGEFEFSESHTDMHPFDFSGLLKTVEKLKEQNVPIYFTIDLDCLDPSCFPGTGTPEAGGVNFLSLLDAVRCVLRANVIGVDLNELCPSLDLSGQSTALACKILREILLAF